VSGLLVIIFGILGLKLFPTFGFLVPLGFEEGPGQALSVGKVWEGFGFAQAATLGLTFAAIGYFFAFFVGVPLVNWGIRKGLAAHGNQDLSRDVLTGIIS
ncbi:MAG: sodium:glutamate symporter, partial [Phycisphaerae bacterium]|nr:sodium:glutamate symporter [Phycisphaerae bacterium]